jgi:hypothetical protein
MAATASIITSTAPVTSLNSVPVTVIAGRWKTLRPDPAKQQVYSLEPDLRKCAFPFCGGWYLNPVNLATVSFQNEEQALNAPSSFAPIYIAKINYRALGLTQDQIKKFEQEAYAGKALIRGTLSDYRVYTQGIARPVYQLLARGAWLAANGNPHLGPYLDVRSSGIVCITTPCPYYEAELINTDILSLFDRVTFERARLTREQETLAWREISQGGLFMTAVTFSFEGLAGEGTGLAATQVYFSYPK